MRRLLYVAMTRARKRLVLSWPHKAGAGDQTEQKPSAFYEEARAAVGAEEEERNEELLGIHEDLYAAFRMLRDEVMGGVAQVGARMGEMRLDAHLDAAAAIARYMELLKLASLIERHPRPEELPAAIAEINSLITQTASAEQRQLYQDSNLDELLLETERENLRRRKIVGDQSEVSLEAYLPIRGGGLMLSATDIDVYRTCPLQYKFARVYNIPKEQTLPQRFGILVHQVLERYHSQLANEEVIAGTEAIREPTPDKLMTLFETGWRRLGFSDSNEERQLHEKAVVALERYHERFAGDQGLAGLVRAQLLVPHRPPPAARPRRPRRPPPGRLLRADRLQDRPGAHALAAQGRHPAVAVPARRARVMEARLGHARATTTCWTTSGPAGAVAGGRDPHHRDRHRGGRPGSSTRSSSRSRRSGPARSATSS